MPEQAASDGRLLPSLAQSGPDIEATYKAREAEGLLDVYFYRRVGFRLAQLFNRLGASPSVVSVVGGICGVVAGHLYFYVSLPINAVGMFLHVCQNALDNADGQLARLTNTGSREGRIVDSVADHAVFVSVYMHLALRGILHGGSPWIGALALAAGISHALQGAAADYYRNAFLFLSSGGREWDSSEDLRALYRSTSWSRDFRRKLLLLLYLDFTRRQEWLAPRLNELRARFSSGAVPQGVRAAFCEHAVPMFKYWSLLMTNTRMLILFLLLIIGRPLWYFWIELTFFNVLLVFLLLNQEKLCRLLLQQPVATAA
jgi:hypothetical protein